MITGFYTSAGGAVTQGIRHGVVANNLANVDTVGFRRDVTVISTVPPEGERAGLPLLERSRLFESLGGGALPTTTHTVHEPGKMRQTGRPLDVAIAGAGFFRVRRANGSLAYTRAGNFRLAPDGRLLTADGLSEVLGDGGSAIQLPDENVQIGRDGAIRRDGAELGRLGLVRFAEPSRLEKVGENLFVAGARAEGGIGAGEVEVQQGQLEISGANAMESMVAMIEALRAYEANMSFIRIQDQTLARAVADLGRLS